MMPAYDTDRIEAARRRLPRAFALPLSDRLAIGGCWLGFALLTGYCLWRFDMSPVRLWAGMGELGAIVLHLFPPMPGEHPREIFWALLETIARDDLYDAVLDIERAPMKKPAVQNVEPLPIKKRAFG